MPAKYSHVKKKSVSGLLKKSTAGGHIRTVKEAHNHRPSNPHIDRSISQAMSSVSQLERAIARILLIRYDQDIARLFSARLHNIALVHLPTLAMRCISAGGSGWVAFNANCDEIKDFFRAAISMDMRQAGERVATKSVLWSYTALRHFALSNNVPVCPKRGLHSLRLLPYYPALMAHLDLLESMPPLAFTKPPHLCPLTEGLEALEEACKLKYPLEEGESEWRPKVRMGYERLNQTLWKVAREFDVRGYGMVLREKLTTKWCDCGCSMDHLGELCERTVRDEEQENGVRSGKQREWDGRGSGVYGWDTTEEEDIWEVDLDFGGVESDNCEELLDCDMTVGHLMEWRYFRAEREKELGNAAFRRGDYDTAVKLYEKAHDIEPELPHYQLNLAAAHLKLQKWLRAEEACTKALNQHRSEKGYYRRAKARKMLGRAEDAIKDLQAVLKIQPANAEALFELTSLLPPDASLSTSTPSSSSQASQIRPSSPSQTPIPKSKPSKPPPFERTESDDYKLKIVMTPMAVDMPLSPAAKGALKGKEKGTKNRKKSGTPKLRSETFTCPSWERYSVKRVD